jgi:hypothetical protein
VAEKASRIATIKYAYYRAGIPKWSARFSFALAQSGPQQGESNERIVRA